MAIIYTAQCSNGRVLTLLVACETQLSCIMFVETQLSKGADKEAKDRFGRVLLHGA